MPNPVELRYFRPISLVACAYKLLFKILTNRLKSVLPSIISSFQGVFVQGRQILDGVFITNELIDLRIMSKQGGVVFKIDLKKVCDHVEWSFVIYMLRRFGFRDKCGSWMGKCISTTSFTVLVNGSPFRLFKPSRGIRQGVPLSPFLFNLVVEALSALLFKAKHYGFIDDFAVGSDLEAITHLQFVDDTILFSFSRWEEVLVQ